MLLNNLAGSNSLTWAPAQYADNAVVCDSANNCILRDSLARTPNEMMNAFPGWLSSRNFVGVNLVVKEGPKFIFPKSKTPNQMMQEFAASMSPKLSQVDVRNNLVVCDSANNCIVRDDLKLFDGVWFKKAVADTKAWTSKAANDVGDWTKKAAVDAIVAV
jgi:uncharacterized Fe-S cluster protein YjdI